MKNSRPTYKADPVSIAIAKGAMLRIQDDLQIADRIPVKTIENILRQEGIKKREVKEAKNQLGIKTVCVDGEYFWVFPKTSGNGQA